MEVTQWGNPDPTMAVGISPPMTLCAVMIYPQYYALSIQQPDHTIIFLIKPLSLEMSEDSELNMWWAGRWAGAGSREMRNKGLGVCSGLSKRSSSPLHPLQKPSVHSCCQRCVHGWPLWGLTLLTNAILCPNRLHMIKMAGWMTVSLSLCLYSPNPGTPQLQNFLRCQNNKTNYNLVCETLQFLDCICGSTTGGLGLLGLYINEKNVALINQTLESLTEYCQGPCHENQVIPFFFEGVGKKKKRCIILKPCWYGLVQKSYSIWL